MALGKLDIIIAGDTAQLRKDMSTAVGIMQSSTKQMESFAKNASAAIAGYFTFDFFKSQVTSSLNYADSLSKLSQKTGNTANQLYSLNAAAKLSDVEFEALSGSLSKFNKNIGETSKGSGDALNAFKNLGISVKNQDGTLKSSFDILGEISDKFEEMPDGASKATLAMQLFGKSGAAMIPLLNGGSDALKEYLGVMDEETAKAAEAFNDSMTKIGLSFEGIKLSLVRDFSPSLKSLTTDFEDVAKSMKDFSANNDINYYETFKKYADDVTALGIALYGTPILIRATSSALQTLSTSTILSASKVVLFGNELESAIGKTLIAKSALAGLSTAFKTFAPTAALFAITEVFLNWDEITGKVYDNLEKISNFKIQEMIDKQAEYVKTLEDRKSKKEDSNGFLAFLGASWSTMDDNTLRFAKQELLVLQNQLNKNKQKESPKEATKKTSDNGLIDFDAQAQALKKAQDDAERLAKEWAQRSVDITKNISIAQQDELAKPYILLTAKYEEDLAHFKGIASAKEQLTAEYTANIERLNLDTIAKVLKADEDALKKTQQDKKEAIEHAFKMQEEGFRIQSRYINLLDDETDRKVALSYLEADRNNTSLKAQYELGEINEEYYKTAVAYEEDLLKKTLEHYTTYGQVIDGVASGMSSSFQDFFDYQSDNFMEFGDLAKNILGEIYNEIIRVAVVKPLVSSLTTSAFSFFGGTQAYDGGLIPYASGGYTGDGGKYEPKGVVHGGEYVIPAWMVQKNKPLISNLENVRARGYADGGSVGGNVSGGNMRVEIKNESSQSLEVTSATQTYDSEGAVLSIVINGIQKNKMGLRDILESR